MHAFLDGRDTPPKSAEKYLSVLEDALKKACSVWGCEPWLRKRISIRGEVWTEIEKSVPLSYIEAKGMEFKSEQERALAAFSAAKEVGLIPEIWVRGMYIPGGREIEDRSIGLTKEYISCEVVKRRQ